jgi:hypothetical protein
MRFVLGGATLRFGNLDGMSKKRVIKHEMMHGSALSLCAIQMICVELEVASWRLPHRMPPAICQRPGKYIFLPVE